MLTSGPKLTQNRRVERDDGERRGLEVYRRLEEYLVFVHPGLVDRAEERDIVLYTKETNRTCFVFGYNQGTEEASVLYRCVDPLRLLSERNLDSPKS